jgi:hypothetical protein
MVSQAVKENKIDRASGLSPIASLFRIGRQQSYVTYEDILSFIPYPEQDLEYVDRIFACLMSAGIPFGEDQDHLEDIDGLVDKPDIDYLD